MKNIPWVGTCTRTFLNLDAFTELSHDPAPYTPLHLLRTPLLARSSSTNDHQRSRPISVYVNQPRSSLAAALDRSFRRVVGNFPVFYPNSEKTACRLSQTEESSAKIHARVTEPLGQLHSLRVHKVAFVHHFLPLLSSLSFSSSHRRPGVY
jgi:hypothetical protein